MHRVSLEKERKERKVKIREGFVSNSSSSSFILAVRKGHRVKELLDGVDSIVADFARPMVEFLDGQCLYPMDKAISKYLYHDEDEYAASIRRTMMGLLDGEDVENWLFCCGDATDGDRYDVGEIAICYTGMEHTEGNIRLWSQGGY